MYSLHNTIAYSYIISFENYTIFVHRGSHNFKSTFEISCKYLHNFPGTTKAPIYCTCELKKVEVWLFAFASVYLQVCQGEMAGQAEVKTCSKIKTCKGSLLPDRILTCSTNS